MSSPETLERAKYLSGNERGFSEARKILQSFVQNHGELCAGVPGDALWYSETAHLRPDEGILGTLAADMGIAIDFDEYLEEYAKNSFDRNPEGQLMNSAPQTLALELLSEETVSKRRHGLPLQIVAWLSLVSSLLVVISSVFRDYLSMSGFESSKAERVSDYITLAGMLEFVFVAFLKVFDPAGMSFIEILVGQAKTGMDRIALVKELSARGCVLEAELKRAVEITADIQGNSKYVLTSLGPGKEDVFRVFFEGIRLTENNLTREVSWNMIDAMVFGNWRSLRAAFKTQVVIEIATNGEFFCGYQGSRGACINDIKSQLLGLASCSRRDGNWLALTAAANELFAVADLSRNRTFLQDIDHSHDAEDGRVHALGRQSSRLDRGLAAKINYLNEQKRTPWRDGRLWFDYVQDLLVNEVLFRSSTGRYLASELERTGFACYTTFEDEDELWTDVDVSGQNHNERLQECLALSRRPRGPLGLSRCRWLQTNLNILVLETSPFLIFLLLLLIKGEGLWFTEDLRFGSRVKEFSSTASLAIFYGLIVGYYLEAIGAPRGLHNLIFAKAEAAHLDSSSVTNRSAVARAANFGLVLDLSRMEGLCYLGHLAPESEPNASRS